MRGEDSALELERPERRVAHAVVDAVRVSRPDAAGIHEIPLALALEHNRPLDIVLRSHVAPYRPLVVEREKRLEVGRKLDDVAAAPTAVDHVPLVLVLEDILVDRLRSVPELVDERLPKKVAVRPLGGVGDCNADAAVLLVAECADNRSRARIVHRVSVIRGEENVVLPVLLVCIRGPHAATRPRNVLRVERPRMLRPRDKILRGEEVEEQSIVVGCARICREDPVGVTVEPYLRIGIPALEKLVRPGVSAVGRSRRLHEPAPEFAVELSEAAVRHPDAVQYLLVGHKNLVVRGIDGARRARRVGESDGHAHGAPDARGEVRTVEVWSPLLRGFSALGCRRVALDDPRPAALAAREIAHRVGDRWDVERRTGEVAVEAAEIEPEAAALGSALVDEAPRVHVGHRRDPVHSAIDAKEDGIIEVFLARHRDAGRGVSTARILRLLRGVELVILLLKPLLLPLAVHRPVVDGELGADCVVASREVVRPAAETGGVYAYDDRERRLGLVLRHREETVDAASKRGEGNLVEVELAVRALFDALELRIKGDLLRELHFCSRPELVEVGGRGAALPDLLRLETDTEHMWVAVAAFCLRQLQPKEPGFAERAGNPCHGPSGNVDRHLGNKLRPEVVKRRVLHLAAFAQVRRVKHRHCESRRLSAAVDASGLVCFNLVSGRERRERGEERKRSERPFHHGYFAFIV